MDSTFSDADIDRIAEVLGVPPKQEGEVFRFKLHDKASGRRITLEITRGLTLPKTVADEMPGNLVSVMAPCSMLQLQGCTGYIASRELGEVIFFARRAGVTGAKTPVVHTPVCR